MKANIFTKLYDPEKKASKDHKKTRVTCWAI